jgi:riboflavin biosynthesis pyrimidine reductase
MPLPASLALVYDAHQPHPQEIPLQAVYRDLHIAAPPGRPAVIVNMVQTLDGVVAIEGKAWSIGSEVDHYLFRTLRGWADAVLSGAGTLRLNDVIVTTHSHLHTERRAAGRPANPVAVVISAQANFSDEVLSKRFFTQPDFASIVLTTERIRDVDRRRIEAAGAAVWAVPATAVGEVDVRAALSLLLQRGHTRVLVEGGPSTNRRLTRAGLIDELFVTLAPTVAGAPDPQRLLAGLLGGAKADLRLISEFQHRAPHPREWYFRFGVASSSEAAHP